VATTTLLVSGIPAALVERAVPASREAPGPNWIWALVALLLCFPAFVRILLMSGAVQ
jgi:hypothetical protein